MRSEPPCDVVHEAISASLDGEPAVLAAEEVEAHLTTCEGCRDYASGAEALNRSVRVRPAEPVPDLTASILAAAPGRSRRTEPAVPGWARYGLLAAALTVLLLAIPELVSGAGPHDGRDLAAFEVALCASLLVVVWQPHRAAGLLPMAAALAVASVASAAVDVVNGSVPLAGEATHVLVLVGLALLWVMDRAAGRPPAPASPRPVPA
jgi:predicted anti-sigma-YlaC factor YlaD